MAARDEKELIKLRADPLLRRAIKIRAAWDDSTITEVVIAAMRQYLAEEIAEVELRESKGRELPKRSRKGKGDADG